MSSHPESFNFATCEATVGYRKTTNPKLPEQVLFTCRPCHVEATASATHRGDLANDVAETILNFCRKLK